MRIAIGTDHRGFAIRSKIVDLVRQMGHEVIDVGTFSPDAVDYPDIAADVARRVSRGEVERGILVCGTGLGMCIAANKVRGVRAAACHDDITAEMSRRHNDSNVLCLSGRSAGRAADRPDDRDLAEHALRGRPPRPPRRQDHRTGTGSRGVRIADGDDHAMQGELTGSPVASRCVIAMPLRPASLPVPAATLPVVPVLRAGLGQECRMVVIFYPDSAQEIRRRPVVGTWKIRRGLSTLRFLGAAAIGRQEPCTIRVIHNPTKSISCSATPSCATSWSAISTSRSAG